MIILVSVTVTADGIPFINLALSVDHMYYFECFSGCLSNNVN